MSNIYKWGPKKLVGSKMVCSCLNADLPGIICNKDKTYTVKAPGTKPMTYEEWDDAVARAIDIGQKAKKEVRKLERDGAFEDSKN